MKRLIAIFIFSFNYCSAQPIESKDLAKYSKEISNLQLAVDGKTYTDARDNQTYTLSFPNANFNVLYSSGLSYKAVYKNAISDQLFVTEQIDFSKAKTVTAKPVVSKSSLQAVQVVFPEGEIVTQIIEHGVLIKTIKSNSLEFYYATGNTTNKNKLIATLNALVKLLTKEAATYHAVKNGKLVLDDGIYNGYYKGFKRREGKGIMEYKNEPKYKGVWIYNGEWKNDVRDGQGSLVSQPYKVGDVVSSDNYIATEEYKGIWKNNQLEGTGTYEKRSFEKYEGNFVSGKREGKGKLTNSSDKSIYEGDWKNGKFHGKGVLTSNYGSQSIYDGEWKNGLRDGKGTYTESSYKYVGEYKNGLKEGQGVLIIGADKYNGQWKKGKKEGEGEYIWENGNKYNGMWKADDQDGKGIMSYANGEKYDGEWKRRKKSGQGIYRWANGDVYEGEWNDDEMNGKGIMTYANGEKYDGQWKRGKKNGAGVLYDKNNNKIKDFQYDMGGPILSVLSNEYILTKSTVLNNDIAYLAGYTLTDSTFILYLNAGWPTIYFDVNNNNKVDYNIDRGYQWFRQSKWGGYLNFYAGNGNIYIDRAETPFKVRYSNRVYEFIFPLGEITTTDKIVFQISFQIEDSIPHKNLPDRKEKIDFKKNKLFYIPLKP